MARRRHTISADDLIRGTPRQRAGARGCDAPGCALPGEFKAPKSPDALDDHHWFCLEHVREYNARWNYFAGKSEDEVEALRRGDTYWHRPTWPLNGRLRFRAMDDLHGFFAEEEAAARAEREASRRGARGPGAGSPEADALAVMELTAPVTREAIKRRYKELVKRHHPDANGGDRQAEERLKAINQAYTTLMRAADARHGAPAA